MTPVQIDEIGARLPSPVLPLIGRSGPLDGEIRPLLARIINRLLSV